MRAARITTFRAALGPALATRPGARKDAATTARQSHTGHSARTSVRLSWHDAGRRPDLRATAFALCAVLLVNTLAVLAIGLLFVGSADGPGPPPVPSNNEPSPFERAP